MEVRPRWRSLVYLSLGVLLTAFPGTLGFIPLLPTTPTTPTSTRLYATPKKIEVTPDLVRKTAQLAQLDVKEEELSRLVPKIKQFLNFVDQMQTVQDHGDDSPKAKLPEVLQVVRPEGSAVFPNQDSILRNMPREEEGYLRVPKVAEEET